MIENLNEDSFSNKIQEDLVLVDFWAEWCGPCKMIAPILEEISYEIPNLKIAKVNIDDNQNIATSLSIQSIPTLVLFKKGEIVDKIIGAVPKNNIVDVINRHL